MLKSDGCQKRMLCAARAAVLDEDQAEVRAVGVPTVGELVEIFGSASKRPATDSQEGLRIRARGVERCFGQDAP